MNTLEQHLVKIEEHLDSYVESADPEARMESKETIQQMIVEAKRMLQSGHHDDTSEIESRINDYEEILSY